MRNTARCVWAALLIATAATTFPVVERALAQKPGAASATRTLPRSALAGSPGWTPPADPESLALVTGRRAAGAVSMPLRGGRSSLDQLGRAAVSAIEGGDALALERLCVTESEFDTILWPEFPQSRPITGVHAADAWYFLERRNRGGISRAIQEYGRQPLTCVRVRHRGSVERYRNFRLLRGITLVVSGADGALDSLDVVRAVVERRGAYKLYSLRD